MNKNLSALQSDYSIFLPALSGFYSTFVGKQRYGNYVNPTRVPASFTHGVESLNFLNADQGIFNYKWCLYSAGHANLDLNKFDESEDMIRNRDRSSTLVVGDSGGYQIAKGVWPADWKDPNCPKAAKKRKEVLAWMDGIMDYGMTLDIPAWVINSPTGSEATGIRTYADAVKATFINNEYFINNRNGNCKFLNVLQGETHTEADEWYDHMKKYCDPKQYSNHFNGWAMGGQNKCDMHLVLKRINQLRFDGLLEKGVHDWMHFLGMSKLEWACLLTDIQRAIRKNHNSNFTVSFDCASPFLATANGQIYTNIKMDDRGSWSYKMYASVDDKKYHTDSRLFKDAVIQDNIFKIFESSPVIDQVAIKDICYYGPTDLNKIGKIGRTSWDAFSYAIMMGHNIWLHCEAVQRANRSYDAGIVPKMLVEEENVRRYMRDAINEIFSISDKGKSDAIIDDLSLFWTNVVGTRGTAGRKTVNSNTYFSKHFVVEKDTTPLTTEVLELGKKKRSRDKKKEDYKPIFTTALFNGDGVPEHSEEFSELEINNLDHLEEGLIND